MNITTRNSKCCSKHNCNDKGTHHSIRSCRALHPFLPFNHQLLWVLENSWPGVSPEWLRLNLAAGVMMFSTSYRKIIKLKTWVKSPSIQIHIIKILNHACFFFFMIINHACCEYQRTLISLERRVGTRFLEYFCERSNRISICHLELHEVKNSQNKMWPPEYTWFEEITLYLFYHADVRNIWKRIVKKGT